MPRDSQDGLKWEYGVFDIVPHWTRQPSIPAIENVCRQQLNISSGDLCRVSSFASGTFNKLYQVDYADLSLLMRVSLPVYPHHKTNGEVATLAWLRQNTTVPVPNVVAFDDSNDNEIGFEWILMEFMPGSRAHQKWRTMTMEQKVALTKRVADIQMELFCHGKPNNAFKNIGTLERNVSGESDASEPITPGRLTSQEFFIGNRFIYDVPRGPFRCSYEWLESQLKIIILEQTAVAGQADDDDDKEDAEEIIMLARRLLSVLPRVFRSAEEAETDPTVLWHDDLNLRNILVDDNGEITAIVDWESVSALPMWITADMPKFLQGDSRQKEPRRADYADETAESAASRNGRDPDELDNEGKNPLYWIHRMEYEVTQLRQVYETRLKQLWPEWPLRDSHIKVDFYTAVLQCSAGVSVKMTNRWIDQLEGGKVIRWWDA